MPGPGNGTGTATHPGGLWSTPTFTKMMALKHRTGFLLLFKRQHIAYRNAEANGLIHCYITVRTSNSKGVHATLFIRKRNKFPCNPLMTILWLNIKIFKYARCSIMKSRICIADRTTRYECSIASAAIKMYLLIFDCLFQTRQFRMGRRTFTNFYFIRFL